MINLFIYNLLSDDFLIESETYRQIEDSHLMLSRKPSQNHKRYSQDYSGLVACGLSSKKAFYLALSLARDAPPILSV